MTVAINSSTHFIYLVRTHIYFNTSEHFDRKIIQLIPSFQLKMSNNILLRTAYYYGVLCGLFTFYFNSKTSRFELSKILQYYNRIVFVVINVFSVYILLIYETPIPSQNLVIKIATPFNFFVLVMIVLNAYHQIRTKEKQIVELLNFGLEVDEIVTKNGNIFKFTLKSFLRTFAIDFFLLQFVLIIFYRSIFVHKLDSLYIRLVVSLQAGKNLNRFLSHLYICGIDFSEHLLENIFIKLEKLTDHFDGQNNFDNNSKYEFIKNCCEFSDDLDYLFGGHGVKILELMKRLHALFSGHILLLVTFLLTDVLVLVNLKSYLLKMQKQFIYNHCRLI